MLIKKYTKSLMGKWLFYFTPEAVQIRRIFFPLGNPPYAKKYKRAYILTSFQALLKAEFFLPFVQSK